MDSNGLTPRFIVDASVAVKWYLKDEDDVQSADALLADFRDDRIQLIAPGQIRFEVPSAFLNAVRMKRLPLDQLRQTIGDFLAWRILTVANDDLILAASDLALRFECALYDGLYLALAESAECPLIHADKRLRNSLGAGFPRAVWLGDYIPVG